MKKILFSALLFAISTQTKADEAQFGLTSGLDFSSGKYGQSESTRIKYIPFTGKVEYGRWLFKTTVPWLEINGPSGVTGDSNIIIVENINKFSKESGLGDVISSLTYTAFQSAEQKFLLDVGAKVKFGTASTSKGLGTGKNDYSVQLDAYKTLHSFDKLTLLGTVGYKTFGKPDFSNYTLSDVWYGTLGTAYRIDAANSAGLLFDFRQAAWKNNTNVREYTLYYSHRFNPTYNVQTYVSTGDTRSSIDFGAGLMLGISW
jgi:hypothetical protein